MSACEKHTVDLMLYLDDELVDGKLMEFLAHLKICADCRASLEEQLALSAVLRRSRPLYSAPPKLRARVAASLASAGANTASNQLDEGGEQWLRRTLRSIEQLLPRWKVLVPAVPGMMLCFLLVSNVVHEVRASEYVNEGARLDW
jgi:anti-sigma factor RsiW